MSEFDIRYNTLLESIYNRFPSFQVVGDRAFKPGLDNMWLLQDKIGFDLTHTLCIHIAGTNGKGSTSSMIASAAMQLRSRENSPLKVGLYTSPHLVDFRERIKINGEMVSKEFVFNFLDKYSELFDRVGASFFEITTAMAFSYFSQNKIDIAVIECGLGGRLDSTNIITPALSVITNIGYDHCAYLGNTLEEIAFEKGGIIKQGVPAVIGEEDEALADVFRKIAKERGANIYFTKDYAISNNSTTSLRVNPSNDYNEQNGCIDEHIALIFKSIIGSVDKSKMDLKGDCQSKNLNTVALALSIFLSRICFDDNSKSLYFRNLHPLDCSNKSSDNNSLKSNILSLSELISKSLSGRENSEEIETGCDESSIEYGFQRVKSGRSDSIYQQEGREEVEMTEKMDNSAYKIATLLDTISYGIENAAKFTSLRGRWEVLQKSPLIVCDIGHNSHGFKVLMPQISRTYSELKDKNSDAKLIFIFGVMKDKDLDSIKMYLHKEANYLCVNASNERAMRAQELHQIMLSNGFNSQYILEDANGSSIFNAIDKALEMSSKDDFIFIGGSSYVVAEALQHTHFLK